MNGSSSILLNDTERRTKARLAFDERSVEIFRLRNEQLVFQIESESQNIGSRCSSNSIYLNSETRKRARVSSSISRAFG